MKSKFTIDGKIFHLIEGVEFGGYPIYSNGDKRIVLKDGKVIHEAKIVKEQIKFLRHKFHRRGGATEEIFSNKSSRLLKERGRVKARPLEKEG